MSYTKSRRFATVAAATIAIAGLGLGTAPIAFAQGDTTVNRVGLATINPEARTSLTIHKYEGPATTPDLNRDGEELQTPPDRTPLEGAGFTIHRVDGVDLTTNEGWEAAKTYFNSSEEPANMNQVEVEKFTGTDGVVEFSDLPIGLYYVVETTPPDLEDGTTYTPAVPFYVTLPMTTAENNAWNYNVHVYPKNDKVTKPHKAVLDGNTGTPNQDAIEGGNGITEGEDVRIGDSLTYRVSANIPNYGDVVGPPAEGTTTYTAPDGVVDHNDLNMLWVGDSFNEHVTFDPRVAENVSVRIGVTGDPTLSTNESGETLEAGTDYTVTENAAGMYIVMLTEAGLDKAALVGDTNIVVDFVTTVTSIPAGGELPNSATVWPGSKPSVGSETPTPNPETPPPGEPTNEVVSKFGKIRIEKIGITGPGEDEVGNPTDTEVLPDATFEIYRAVGQTEGATTESGSCAPGDLEDQEPLDTIVSGADGRVETSVFLRLSNWYNDGVEQAPGVGNNDGYLDGEQYANKYGWQNYCLVEVQSPEGYQLLAEPVKFSLTEHVPNAETGQWTWTTVTNQADNIDNELPLTGGQGLALLSLAGLVLVGGGVAYYTMSSRREEQATA